MSDPVKDKPRATEVLVPYLAGWRHVRSPVVPDADRIEPFDAIELDLRLPWVRMPLPTRAQEEAAEYDDG